MKEVGLYFLFLTIPLLGATRGHDAGNFGGYTVRCDAHAVGGARLEVLDYHEIPKRFPAGSLTLDLGKTGDEWARVKYVLDRLRRLDPTRADRYQEQANRFLDNVNWVDHVNLPNVADLGTFWVEDSCSTKPTIIQYHGPIPEQKLYSVDKTTFDQLDSIQRAGLILHEIIYGEAIEHGASDSSNSRYLNALISSSQIGSLSPVAFHDRLVALGFESGPPATPVWVPIALHAAIAGRPYSASVATAFQVTGPPLTFSKLDGPSWLTVSRDGHLAGTPASGDVGAASVLVEASNASNGDLSAVARFGITVLDPDAITWMANPVMLGTVEPGKPFCTDFHIFLSHPMATTVSFTAVGLPSWMTLEPSGRLCGTPGAGDVGAYGFQVSLIQNGHPITASVVLGVSNSWDFSVKERQTSVISLNAPPYLAGLPIPAGSPLTFSVDTEPAPPPFVILAPDGALTMMPQRTDVGEHMFNVRISWGSAEAYVHPVHVRVALNMPPPPPDEPHLVAKAGQPFTFDLNQSVFNPDGGPMTFALVDGPKWLTLSSLGVLSGIPTSADVGSFTALTIVTNSQNESTSFRVFLDVRP